jgi:hypothetical protein
MAMGHEIAEEIQQPSFLKWVNCRYYDEISFEA